MKKLVVLAALVAASSSLAGCAGLAFTNRGVPMGFLYTDASANEKVTENALAAKKGEACANSVLGLVTTGDASVPAAAQAGGITRVASVDHHYSDILGLYSTYCVVVTGE